MLQSIITRGVESCIRYAWPVVIVAIAAALASAVYAVKHFAINTDISKLISPTVPWHQRESRFEAAFPERYETILIVVQAPTPELVSQASQTLVDNLRRRTNLFHSVEVAGGGEFFRKNGLLFLPTDEVERTTGRLAQGAPLIGTLASDPSLRGLTQALSFTLMGVQMGQSSLDQMAGPYTAVADTLDHILAGRPANFSWHALLNGHPPQPSELRRFIQAHAILDYSALEPGKAATDAIRQTVSDLKLASEFGATVRLTGPVAIADEEFATVQEGALVNTAATVVIVLTILWLALRSARIILAVFITLFVGLAIASALGLMMVGALNLISVAFAVLFVGLGVDFGLQFSVRYRAERHEVDDLRQALLRAAAQVGAPLTLAAAATAAGFMSFLPTAYRGVSELGLIAGVGMIIAFVTSVTLLPALLEILKPPGEPEPLGYKRLGPVDRFTERHRMPILIVTAVVVISGLPLLSHLQFDFNPIHLRSPNVESVATFLELRGDPAIGANSVSLLAPSLAEANDIAKRLRELPRVSRVTTLSSFVPDDQARKRSFIQRAASALGSALNASATAKPPTDDQNKTALRNAADNLNRLAANKTGNSADAARRLAVNLTKLSQADAATREQAKAVFVRPLNVALADLRDMLQAQPFTLESLPPDIVHDWATPDGRYRADALPKGDPNDNDTLREFAREVLTVAPEAVGGPISILESGKTIVTAFIQAGVCALVSIAILLWITLRRIGDVLLTLVPLLVAGIVTLEICVLIGLELNFANIIALPLLLGVGVAFKIYYIMAWRAGQTSLLQSSLTRAVFFSALTTATAFGSLWLSSHPGTSSMGKLLALSLVCTMAAAVLFQPILMGRPRNAGHA